MKARVLQSLTVLAACRDGRHAQSAIGLLYRDQLSWFQCRTALDTPTPSFSDYVQSTGTSTVACLLEAITVPESLPVHGCIFLLRQKLQEKLPLYW